VYEVIRGPDGEDATVEEAGFAYDPLRSFDDLRVGFLQTDFDEEYPAAANDRGVLESLMASGIAFEPVSTPDFPTAALQFVLTAEAAAAFDTLTRSGQDDLLVRQIQAAWPNVFRAARFIPAVEYIQANRVRSDLVDEWVETLDGLDVVIAPCFQGDQLLSTNLAGLPSMAVPSGLGPDGLPTGVCLIGRPFGEAELVTAARAIQAVVGSNPPRPPGY
jgi:Asp-tRNA(Asn)/Glu-tRNA(Gln) amidotransferase A subunit family amidase